MAKKTTEAEPYTPETSRDTREKMFEVRLKRVKPPTAQGKMPQSGVLYQRGGFRFTESQDFVIVSEAELEKFKIAKHRTFASEGIEYEIDPMLTVREVS